MDNSVLFLGTGTSQGVPMIGCKCDVCVSEDAKDKRLRSSVLVNYKGCTILVDAGPDFRQQMLRADVLHIDGILLTHNHKDHTGGLDDVRAINFLEQRPIDIYCEKYVEDSLRSEYSYAFAESKYPGIPEWRLHRINEEPFDVEIHKASIDMGWLYNMPSSEEEARKRFASMSEDHKASGSVRVIPVRGMHYKLPVLGFRFGSFAYLTDMNYIPETEFGKLHDLDLATINCVRHGKHISHYSFEEAIAVALKIGARKTLLTHLSHQLEPHALLCERIVAETARQLRQKSRPVPPDDVILEMISPAWDGLCETFR